MDVLQSVFLGSAGKYSLCGVSVEYKAGGLLRDRILRIIALCYVHNLVHACSHSLAIRLLTGRVSHIELSIDGHRQDLREEKGALKDIVCRGIGAVSSLAVSGGLAIGAATLAKRSRVLALAMLAPVLVNVINEFSLFIRPNDCVYSLLRDRPARGLLIMAAMISECALIVAVMRRQYLFVAR